jgi:hypothetical protein
MAGMTCARRFVTVSVLLLAFACGTATTTSKPSGSITVLVVASTADQASQIEVARPEDPPAAGAMVAIDLPGGGHREAIAGADGRVTFTDIDWGLGNAGIVAWAPGRIARGVADVSPSTARSIPSSRHPEDADVVLPLFDGSPLPVVFTVSAPKKANPQSLVEAWSTTGGFAGTTGQPVEVRQRWGAYSIVAFETVSVERTPRELLAPILRWARFDGLFPTPDADLALDLVSGGETLEPSRAGVRLVVAGGDDGPLGKMTPSASTTSLESRLLLGTTVSATMIDQDAFELTMEKVSVDGQTPITTFGFSSPDGGSTWVSRVGVPVDGESVDGFLPIPIPSDVVLALHEPIVLAGTDAQAVSVLSVLDAGLGRLLDVRAPPGTKAMHVPSLPVAARATILGAAQHGSLGRYADHDPSTGLTRRTAFSPLFLVTP